MYTNIDDIIPPLNNEGYDIQDPWDVVEAFEDKVAKYAGSKYAVATDSCTNSLFLCLKYLNATGKVKVPKKTYLSVQQTYRNLISTTKCYTCWMRGGIY